MINELRVLNSRLSEVSSPRKTLFNISLQRPCLVKDEKVHHLLSWLNLTVLELNMTVYIVDWNNHGFRQEKVT